MAGEEVWSRETRGLWGVCEVGDGASVRLESGGFAAFAMLEPVEVGGGEFGGAGYD